jgi:ribosomal protein S27AE
VEKRYDLWKVYAMYFRKKMSLTIHKCAKCGLQGTRAAVSSHIIEAHLDIGEVRFSCGLCGYRASSQSKLNKHVHGYKPHLELK